MTDKNAWPDHVGLEMSSQSFGVIWTENEPEPGFEAALPRYRIPMDTQLRYDWTVQVSGILPLHKPYKILWLLSIEHVFLILVMIILWWTSSRDNTIAFGVPAVFLSTISLIIGNHKWNEHMELAKSYRKI